MTKALIPLMATAFFGVWIEPDPALSQDVYCEGVALQTITAMENPSAQYAKGSRLTMITQYREVKGDRFSYFCMKGDYCYQAAVKKKGQRKPLVDLLNCAVDATIADEFDGETMRYVTNRPAAVYEFGGRYSVASDTVKETKYLEIAFGKMTPADRQTIQMNLAAIGLYSGTIDGQWGRGTESALVQADQMMAEKTGLSYGWSADEPAADGYLGEILNGSWVTEGCTTCD